MKFIKEILRVAIWGVVIAGLWFGGVIDKVKPCVTVHFTDTYVSEMFFQEICRVLPSRYPVQSLFIDEKYTLFTEDQITALLTEWKEVLSTHFEWQSTYDCDDFAAEFHLWVQKEYKDKIYTAGIACFRYGYDGHMINIMFTKEGAVLVEPQSGERVTWTQEHIQLFRYMGH